MADIEHVFPKAEQLDEMNEHLKKIAENAGGGSGAVSDLNLKKGEGEGSVVQGETAKATGVGAVAFGESTSSKGPSSYSEGHKNISGDGAYWESSVQGRASHSEGLFNDAKRHGSHTEGIANTVYGDGGHAEGAGNIVYSEAGHAEGSGNTVYDKNGHAEGAGNHVTGDSGHAEGIQNYVGYSGAAAHAEGMCNHAQGAQSHAEGYGGCAAGGDNPYVFDIRNVVYANTDKTRGNHSEGLGCSTVGHGSHAEGLGCTACAEGSHAEGAGTVAKNRAAHAEGEGTLAEGYAAHAEGNACEAMGGFSHAEGDRCHAVGYSSHAGGMESYAYGTNSFAHGNGALAKWDTNIALGSFNDSSQGVFQLGNGTASDRNNALYVTMMGDVHAQGTVSESGADYAEMYEWFDGNIDAEDRRGLFVTLNGDKIVAAKDSDEYILGIISARPAILGDEPTTWYGKYLLDVFGAPITKQIGDPGTARMCDGWIDMFAINNTDISVSRDEMCVDVVVEGCEDARALLIQFIEDGETPFNLESVTVNDSTENIDKVFYGVWGNDDFRPVSPVLDGSVEGIGTSNDVCCKFSYIVVTLKNPETVSEVSLRVKTGEVVPELKVQYSNSDMSVFKFAEECTEFILNPEYDPDQSYTPRENRPEWDPVGTHGKLVVIDDGTCEVNGYCWPSENGVATADTVHKEYRVIERVDDSHVRVVLK